MRNGYGGLLGALGLVLMAAAPAPPCHEERIQTANGRDIFTMRGQYFLVFPGDRAATWTWLPLDRLRICRLGGNAFELTDLSAPGPGPHRARGLYVGGVPSYYP